MFSSADRIRAIAQEIAKRQERGQPMPTSLPTASLPIDTPLVQPPQVPYSISATAQEALSPSNQTENVDIPVRPGAGTMNDPELQAIIQAISERYAQPQQEQQPHQSLLSNLFSALAQGISVYSSRDPGAALERQIFTKQEKDRIERQLKSDREEKKKDLMLQAKVGSITGASAERKAKQERELDRLDKISEKLDRRRQQLEDFEMERQLRQMEIRAKQIEKETEEEKDRRRKIADRISEGIPKLMESGVSFEDAHQFLDYLHNGLPIPKSLANKVQGLVSARTLGLIKSTEESTKRTKQLRLKGDYDEAKVTLRVGDMSEKDKAKRYNTLTTNDYWKTKDSNGNPVILNRVELDSISEKDPRRRNAMPLSVEERIFEGDRRYRAEISAKESLRPMKPQQRQAPMASSQSPTSIDPNLDRVKRYAKKFNMSEEQARKELGLK